MTKSSTSTAEGVVDPAFRVIGTSNLRVIDNSILVRIVQCCGKGGVSDDHRPLF